MFKVFLDTNILFSYFYEKQHQRKSGAALLLELSRKKKCQVIVSELVKEELFKNIYKIKIDRQDVRKELKNFLIKPDITIEENYWHKIEPAILDLPENDKIILTTAIFYKANLFVTGSRKDFNPFYNKKFLNTYIYPLKGSIQFLLEKH